MKIVGESHAQGVLETSKKYKVSENRIYTWRRKYGGMEPNQVAAMKRGMQENARLKNLLAERDLEIEVMKEITSRIVGLPQRNQAVTYAASRGRGQRGACELIGVSLSMLTYQRRSDTRDAPLLHVIMSIVQEHPTWGVRLIHGYMWKLRPN